jgi:methylmalonyl-CoA mutase cobalamin-binding subunit
MSGLSRSAIFPDPYLPDVGELLSKGNELAATVKIGQSPFLSKNSVECEAEYKWNCANKSDVMIHSQIGYRDPEKTKRAYRQIWEEAGSRGSRVDRYGICLDWSMGFKSADRKKAQKGTGLILPSEEAFAELTHQAPVAPHFGDFVIGMPAAVENTTAALRAGSTAIGNLGQYFTFRLPGWDNDIEDTAATVEALALAAAQPVDVLIHSNLDDGFAALFTDLSCSLGAVLLEQYIVDDLIGGKSTHCYGHSFSEPFKRLAFQLALGRVSRSPGSMVYGNTVAYEGEGHENYAALAAYLSVDAAAQLVRPSGHAINPVPITEAIRIPDIDEVIDAVVFAGRMVERVKGNEDVLAFEQADQVALKMIEGAERFKADVLAGLELGGIDTTNPFEMLLSLRRIGAKRLEEEFGPGNIDPTNRRGRAPLVQSSTIAALETAAEKKVAKVPVDIRETIKLAGLKVCLCTTDVHEYGKILLEETLDRLSVVTVDAGIHADPDKLVEIASHGIDAIAVSTYNGVALDYLKELRCALDAAGLDVPILMGGKTNQIPQGSNSSLPVDVSGELETEGALVCRSIEDMVPYLVQLAEKKAV